MSHRKEGKSKEMETSVEKEAKRAAKAEKEAKRAEKEAKRAAKAEKEAKRAEREAKRAAKSSYAEPAQDKEEVAEDDEEPAQNKEVAEDEDDEEPAQNKEVAEDDKEVAEDDKEVAEDDEEEPAQDDEEVAEDDKEVAEDDEEVAEDDEEEPAQDDEEVAEDDKEVECETQPKKFEITRGMIQGLRKDELIELANLRKVDVSGCKKVPEIKDTMKRVLCSKTRTKKSGGVTMTNEENLQGLRQVLHKFGIEISELTNEIRELKLEIQKSRS